MMAMILKLCVKSLEGRGVYIYIFFFFLGGGVFLKSKLQKNGVERRWGRTALSAILAPNGVQRHAVVPGS